ncbi:Vacuolar protein sorting-associated protein 72 [Coemansia sp. RSA 1199]|nr:Vacuolar protein sorting-associated protein 72 [Coemansia sp. RSA 1199]
MSLSSGRRRRQNAGNKMLVMIQEERAKIESGEAVLSDEDEDFARKDDVEDIVDSDFEETDSEAEQTTEAATKEAEDMLEKAKRRKLRKMARKHRVVPQFASSKRKTADSRKCAIPAQTTDSTESAIPVAENQTKLPEFAVRFSSRASAVRKAQESEALEQEREELAAIKRKRRKGKRNVDEPELTQEQLLEEAKQTEIENIEKLKEFQTMEAEEKQRQRRMAARKEPLMIRPIAHWESRTVPIPADPDAGSTTEFRSESIYALKHLDKTHYPLNPWVSNRPVMPPKICPVTGLPARYFHPRAKVPYSNARAYHILEELVNGQHAYFYDADVWSSTNIPQ